MPVEVTRLTSLQLDEINEIRIPKNNGNDILFNKSQSSNGETFWEMLSPYKIKAHQFRINTLLSLTQTPVQKFYASSDINLMDYELDKPRARIIFNNTSISFGKSNPLSSQRYILSENKMTLLLDQLYPLVSAQASTFVDLNLLPDNATISSIKLPDLGINKTQQNTWGITPAKKLTADEIQAFIENWMNAQAFSVHRYLQRKQLGVIKILTEQGNIDFIISDDDPWLILARPDLNIEYHLDKTFKNKLLDFFKKSENDA